MSPDHIFQLARRVACRYRYPGVSADDLRQEAALVILQGLRDTLDESHLVVLARRHLGRICKRACRHVTSPIDQAPEPIDDSPQPVEVMTREEECCRLVALCTPAQQIVLELSIRQGLPDEDVAATLGLTLNAVRLRRHQATQRIREYSDCAK